MTSRLSPYSALSLGRQWIHVGFSLRGFWKNFTRFLREGCAVLGLVFVVPVVVHDMCRMVQTMQNCLEVPQVQFLRGCGRRCVHAATSSRQSRDEVQIRSSTSSRRTEMGFLPHF